MLDEYHQCASILYRKIWVGEKPDCGPCKSGLECVQKGSVIFFDRRMLAVVVVVAAAAVFCLKDVARLLTCFISFTVYKRNIFVHTEKH